MNRLSSWKRTVYLKQLFEDGADGNKGGADDAKDGNGAKDGKNGKDGKSGDGDGGKADEKKYSDADLDRIIGQKFAKWQKDQQKAVDEAKKLATMNEQEKAEHERDQYKKELDELKKAQTKSNMGKQARKMLSDESINLPDELVNMIVADDADTTKTNVEQFAKLYKAAVADAVKAALKGKAPGAGGSSSITKEQIMKIKDRVERQRLIAEHMDLFK